jgi:hypothetical protein
MPNLRVGQQSPAQNMTVTLSKVSFDRWCEARHTVGRAAWRCDDNIEPVYGGGASLEP